MLLYLEDFIKDRDRINLSGIQSLYSSHTQAYISEIKRAFGLFDGLTFNGMGVDHSRSHIAMPQ